MKKINKLMILLLGMFFIVAQTVNAMPVILDTTACCDTIDAHIYGDTVGCDGLHLSTDLDSCYSYQWFYDNSLISTDTGITVYNSGNYYVVVSNNCFSDTTNELTVTIYHTPSILSISSTDVSCFGDCDGTATVTAIGQPGMTFLWSNNGTTATINNLCPGEYFVTVSGGGNCYVTDSVVVGEPDSLYFTFGCGGCRCPLGTTCLIATVHGGTSPYTLNTLGWTQLTSTTWKRCVNSMVSYIIQITDANGCVVNDFHSCVFGLKDFEATSKVGQTFKEKIEIYPNPASNCINIRVPVLEESLTVSLVSMDGQAIISKVIKAGESTLNFDISKFAKGIYSIEMTNSTLHINKVVVIN